jgi:hypothetical protein
VANVALNSSLSQTSDIVALPIPRELDKLFTSYGSNSRSRLALLRHTRTANSAAHQWLRRRIVYHLSEQAAAG